MKGYKALINKDKSSVCPVLREWTSVFASERLTGALLDRLTHHVHIMEMNGESYRLKQSRSRRRPSSG